MGGGALVGVAGAAAGGSAGEGAEGGASVAGEGVNVRAAFDPEVDPAVGPAAVGVVRGRRRYCAPHPGQINGVPGLRVAAGGSGTIAPHLRHFSCSLALGGWGSDMHSSLRAGRSRRFSRLSGTGHTGAPDATVTPASPAAGCRSLACYLTGRLGLACHVRARSSVRSARCECCRTARPHRARVVHQPSELNCHRHGRDVAAHRAFDQRARAPRLFLRAARP